jgi:hypothetical protein
LAKSIVLSTRHMLSGTGEPPSRKQLQEIGEEIKTGAPHAYDEFEITRVLHRKRLGERRWTSGDKRRTACFFVVLCSIPATFVIWLLVHRFAK